MASNISSIFYRPIKPAWTYIATMFYYIIIIYHFYLDITNHFIWKHPNRKKEPTTNNCQNIKKETRKMTTKIMQYSNKLLNKWMDSWLICLSTEKRTQHKQSQYRSRHHYHKVKYKSWIPTYLMTTQLMAYVSMANAIPNTNVFDSDSYPILINNCCTACITN